MSDFKKRAPRRRDLEDTRNDLSRRIGDHAPDKADLVLLHTRIGHAITARAGRFGKVTP